MQQVLSIWQGLDARRRAIVAAATVAVFFAVLALAAFGGRQQDMALLYAGLDSQSAGEVLAALDQRGVPYDVQGDTIRVPLADRDSLRMSLAGEGLPATGGVGYELLDSLSGFGTTAQMFDAAYWRAKEGELARTIAASPALRGARVHLAIPTSQPFRSERRATASVAVTMAGGNLSQEQARAIKYLVGSAVPGLMPEDVAVIDASTGRVIRGSDDATDESDRAAELRRNVERLLEARVGPGRVAVEVSLERSMERESISERQVDPNSRVPISTETQETSKSSNETRPANVTVASNLPSGNAAAGGSAQSSDSETSSRTNFELSETRRELLRNPGAVKRLSVAVLVDGTTAPDGSWQARPQDELDALRDLAASAVGFNQDRGDVITIKSLPFEALPVSGTASGSTMFAGPIATMRLIELATLSVVALILGLFVLRPILTTNRSGGDLSLPTGLPAPGIAALTGEVQDGDLPNLDLPVVSPDGDDGLSGIGSFALGGFGGESESPVDRLRRLIDERKEESAEILRAWMEEADEGAS